MWLSGQPGATKTWLLCPAPQPALLLVASRRAAVGKVRIISDTEQQEAEQGRAGLPSLCVTNTSLGTAACAELVDR